MQDLRKHGITLLAAAVLVAGAIWWIDAASTRMLETHYTAPVPALTLVPDPGEAGNGARLVHVSGCSACHGADLTGGVTFRGIFGTRLVAPNLTRVLRHQSDEQIAAAIRYGVKPDGTSIIDMPSDLFVAFSDSDLAAMIAYLRSLPEKPDATEKTHWKLGGRAMLMLGWLPRAAANVDRHARGPEQTPAAPFLRGQYIAHSQCAQCHGADLSGNTAEASPDLRFSIQHYTPAAFAHFFRTGEGQIGHGTKTMTKMIHTRFRYLTDADVRGIYRYLNTPLPKG